MPAGPKLVSLIALVLAVSLLPTALWAAGVAAGVCLLAHLVGLGMRGLRVLGRQAWSLRWVIALMVAGQLVFLGPLPAAVNTVRVTSAVLLAGLIALTTPVTALLDALERGLAPLSLVRLDPARAALMLTVTVGTIPDLARIARDVRDAQRARGARVGIRRFAVPYLVTTLKHADELGDALAARGVR